ncbi:MAG: hypothetical protein ACRDRK_06325 [Pseudonocardia sp.]
MTSTLQDIFEPPDTSARRRHRWQNRIVLAVVGVLLVAATGFAGYRWQRACGGLDFWLDSDVVEVDGECVGVTDGTFVFDEAYTDVEGKIAEENNRVDEATRSGEGPIHVVTVALFLPMTVDDETSPISKEEILHQMQGAYTAQLRVNGQVNNEKVSGDPTPLIRLVLANQGNLQERWEPVVDQLVEMRDAQKAPLVGVIGLGVSIEATQNAARRLSESDIPMVATLATADQLNYDVHPGFVRVAPSNRDQTLALKAYLAQKELRTAILVQDGNPDLFAESTKENFNELLLDLFKDLPTQTFTGTPAGRLSTAATATIFDPVVANICGAQPPPPVAMFAGRKTDLPSFLTSLEARSCRDTPITVVTVGSNSGVLDSGEFALQETALREANILVALAGVADPQRWEVDGADQPAGFSKFYSSFLKDFVNKNLTDGEAILTHDALLTVARAIRLADTAKPGNSVPSSAEVSAQMPNLSLQYSIPGAGGTLSYSTRGADGVDTGNPCGKLIPMLVRPPDPLLQPPVFTTCEI